MSTHEERIAVFNDTFQLCQTDADLISSIALAKSATKVYYEYDYPDVDFSKRYKTVISVEKKRSYEAAFDLYRSDSNSRIAVLNFANAFHPGGGVTKGSSAQEESLCRCSTLYPLLYRKYLKAKYYDYHKQINSPKATDTVVYTPGVVVFKTDTDLPKLLEKEDWVWLNVLTCAAPDLRKKSNVHAPLVAGGSYMNDAELLGYHIRRAIHILTVAAANHVDTLVLGAFGCGAFENNPKVVARAYKIALDEFDGVFKNVCFAIYAKPGNSENYTAFSEVFTCHSGCETSDLYSGMTLQFAQLTRFIPLMKDGNYGEWVHDTVNDGSAEHPKQWPYVSYSRVVCNFMGAFADFSQSHPEYEPQKYSEILANNGIEWNIDSMSEADVAALDAKCIIALITGAIRADRFCDGALLGFFNDGLIVKWLERLDEIDRCDCQKVF